VLPLSRRNRHRDRMDGVTPSAPSPSAQGNAAQSGTRRSGGAALVHVQPLPRRGLPVNEGDVAATAAPDV